MDLRDATGAPLLAFCAIRHARKSSHRADQDLLSPELLAAWLEATRTRAGDRRFFLFDTYHDLSAQLHAAAWLSIDAKNRVVEAALGGA